MDRGRAIAADTAARLKDEVAGDVVTFAFDAPAGADMAAALVAALADRQVRREGEPSVVTAREGDPLFRPRCGRWMPPASPSRGPAATQHPTISSEETGALR